MGQTLRKAFRSGVSALALLTGSGQTSVPASSEFQYTALEQRALESGDPHEIAPYHTALVQRYFPNLGSSPKQWAIETNDSPWRAGLGTASHIFSKTASLPTLGERVAIAVQGGLELTGILQNLGAGPGQVFAVTNTLMFGANPHSRVYLNSKACPTCAHTPNSCQVTHPDVHDANRQGSLFSSEHELAHLLSFMHKKAAPLKEKTPYNIHIEENFANTFAALRRLQSDDPAVPGYLDVLIRKDALDAKMDAIPFGHYSMNSLSSAVMWNQQNHEALVKMSPRQIFDLSEKLTAPLPEVAFNALRALPVPPRGFSDETIRRHEEELVDLTPIALAKNTKPALDGLRVKAAVLAFEQAYRDPVESVKDIPFYAGLMNPRRSPAFAGFPAGALDVHDPAQIKAVRDFNAGHWPRTCPPLETEMTRQLGISPAPAPVQARSNPKL